jgi:zinc protease
MPNQFDFSRTFFDRFYRPEYTTVIVAGDVEPEPTFKLVEKYWGKWQPGSYKADIPAQKPLGGPKYAHVPWESTTLPWVTVAFRGPAFSDTNTEKAALDIISEMSFSNSSDLYRKLVIEEQKAQNVFAWFPDRVEPHLLIIGALVKDPKDAWYVRDQIQQTLAKARTELASAQRVNEIVSHIKYRFANNLTNTSDIAEALVPYVAHTRDPETLNRAYARYDKVTPEMIQDAANQYFTDERMIVTTLSQADLPEGDGKGSVDAKVKELQVAPPDLNTVLLRNASPVVNMRLVFNAGAALDPEGKEGLANLTATYLANSGSQSMTFAEIGEALFPMAASFNAQIDKEMITFLGTSHVNTLNSYFDIVMGQLLEPSWSEEDFERVKANVINNIKVGLRSNNDEELGKEVLYEMIYEDHPYGHLNNGHAHTVAKLTLDDLKAFYKANFTQANLTLGLAGNFSDDFLTKAKTAFAALPKGESKGKIKLPEPKEFSKGLHVKIVEKDTRGTAISMGFPIDINRASEDFAALWLVRSYFGEHRSSNSYLYQRMRKIRGMNYGAYAYIEYFPRGMFQFHPDTNLARQQQVFQIWIRPVVPEQSHFALRVTKYEMDKLLKEGISQADFEATRNYLTKFVNVLTATQDRQLGYAIDSKYYGIGDFNKTIREGLAKLTVDEVNRVLRKYLSSDTMQVAIITKDAEGLKEKILNDTPSPITYESEKPQELLDEDKIIATYAFNVKPENLEIIKVDDVFDQPAQDKTSKPAP